MTTTHPGEILLCEFLAHLEMTQVEFADHIGVSFQTVNTLVNKKRGVSVEMAHRLGVALGTSPEYWLNLQTAYDVSTFNENFSGTIKRLEK